MLEKLFRESFIKNQNCILSWGLLKYIETKLLTTCFYQKFPWLIFCKTFEEKYLSCYTILPNFMIAFTSWDVGQYVYCNCLLTITCCNVITSEINLIFLIKHFFLHSQKVKIKYLENGMSFWDEIKSIFHYCQRAFIETNKKIFGRRKSDFKLYNHNKTLKLLIHNKLILFYRAYIRFILDLGKDSNKHNYKYFKL